MWQKTEEKGNWHKKQRLKTNKQKSWTYIENFFLFILITCWAIPAEGHLLVCCLSYQTSLAFLGWFIACRPAWSFSSFFTWLRSQVQISNIQFFPVYISNLCNHISHINSPVYVVSSVPYSTICIFWLDVAAFRCTCTVCPVTIKSNLI